MIASDHATEIDAVKTESKEWVSKYLAVTEERGSLAAEVQQLKDSLGATKREMQEQSSELDRCRALTATATEAEAAAAARAAEAAAATARIVEERDADHCRLQRAVEDAASAADSELAELRAQHERTLDQLHTRVHEAMTRKDEEIASLTQQLADVESELVGLSY